MTAQDEQPIIWCELSHDTRRLIEEYAEDLRRAAFTIGNHGLTETDFWASGLFQSAIERLRGTQSATTDVKRDFIARMLTYMKQHDYISDWQFSGAGERHDYEVYIGERTCIIEAKDALMGIIQRFLNDLQMLMSLSSGHYVKILGLIHGIMPGQVFILVLAPMSFIGGRLSMRSLSGTCYVALQAGCVRKYCVIRNEQRR